MYYSKRLEGGTLELILSLRKVTLKTGQTPTRDKISFTSMCA